MVLSLVARRSFCASTSSAAMPSFLRGHVEAFAFFGGVPRVLLYDNLKSAVLERAGDAIRFHPTLLELAAHYRFEPRPVAVARGNEKGRVERAIRYVRDSFFAARACARPRRPQRAGRRVVPTGIARTARWPEDTSRTVREVFDEERGTPARRCPTTHSPTDERVEVEVGKTPYVRFDLNDYSVPHDRVRRTLVVVADPRHRAHPRRHRRHRRPHARSWDRGDADRGPSPRRRRSSTDKKRGSRAPRPRNASLHAAPSAEALLARAAERGAQPRQHHVAPARACSMRAAPPSSSTRSPRPSRATLPTLGAVRQVLDQQRAARGKPPAGDHPLCRPAEARRTSSSARTASTATTSSRRRTKP